MPRYIIERSVPGLTREELMAAGRRSVAVLAEMPDVRWIRSYVSDAEGKIYCEYRRPEHRGDSRTCPARRAARRSHSEIALEINPDDVRVVCRSDDRRPSPSAAIRPG